MKNFLSVLLGYFIFLISSSSFSEELPQVAYPLSEVRQIHAKSNNKDYELLIQLPSSYKASSKSYPLIVVNDSRFAFPITSGAMQLMGDRVVSEAIVVGISYAKNEDYTVSRTRDYTPTYSPQESSGHSDAARAVSGHAKEYTQFIQEQVIPELRHYYRIDNNNKIFVGHSFGGLLGSYILINKPEVFDHYIIGSPSLWYDKNVIFKMEEKYAKSHKDLKANVMMYEDDSGSSKKMTMNDLMIFEKLLRSRHYPSLKLHVEILKNENHHSVFPALLSRGLMKSIPIK